MTLRPLILVGAGGFARETAELVRAINDVRPTWDLLGCVDDSPALHGTEVAGMRVLGPCDTVIDGDAQVAVCLGNPRRYTTRALVVDRLGLPPERYATLVHPAAVIPRSVPVGHGTVVHATTVATGWASIGAHVAVMPGVIITHDDRIRDYVTIAAGVRLAGGVIVERGAYLGSGVLVRENLTIGAWSMVGMGALVTKSIPPGELWIGSPASYLRSSDQDADVISATAQPGAPT